MTSKKLWYPIGFLLVLVALVLWLEPTPYRHTRPTPDTFLIESSTPISQNLEPMEMSAPPLPTDPQAVEVQVEPAPIEPSLAPQTETIAEYLQEEQNAPPQPDPNFPDSGQIRPVDVDLWKPLSSIPNHAPNKNAMKDLPDDQWVEFDDSALDTLQTGDQLLLTDPKGGKTPVIVGKKEYLQNQAINWVLFNPQGQRIGSFTQTPNFTEGEYRTPDQKQFFLRTFNGKGWIADQQDLLRNTEDKFLNPNRN